jgi:hypothetical protein
VSEEAKKDESSIIEDHKKMVIMTGSLSDFQLQNLKTWPFLLFDQLETAAITYDFTKLIGEQEELSPGTVQFDFKFKEGTKLERDHTKKQLETLSLWVRFMFWKETKVKFLKSGKKWAV